VDRAEVQALLDSVATGRLAAEDAVELLAAAPYEDLGFARVDHHRALRTGDPEVVYAAGKSPEQAVGIVTALAGRPGERPALVTRVEAATVAALLERFPQAEHDPVARCVLVGTPPAPVGRVQVVAAGTSDGPVAAEAAFTARAFGAGVSVLSDVGVAGLHRLLPARAALDRADCLIVVAGMEGALPSVVGGLVGTPIVAVPTSVGYGSSMGGLAALLAMLNSCAAGVTVCNIDNGFGAGVFAARVARRRWAGTEAAAPR
jgi:NCAIR mutase (PurE)-related protein